MYHNGIMILDVYLKKEGISRKDFAAYVGENPENVSRYCLGSRIPRPEVMRKIYVATRGLVTPNDFYGLPDGSVWFANPPEIDRTEGDDDDVRSL